MAPGFAWSTTPRCKGRRPTRRPVRHQNRSGREDRHGTAPALRPVAAPDAIYLASDPLTAFAETYRLFIRPGGSALPAPSVPSVVLTISGVIVDALDLTDHALQRALDTNLSELTGEWRLPAAAGQEPPTHLLGRVAHDIGGIHALWYASARNPAEGRNMVVFIDHFGCGRGCYQEVYDPSGYLHQRFR